MREARELEALPQEIETMEGEIAALHARLNDPLLYRGSGDTIAGLKEDLARREQALADAYARWEALEARHAARE
jgi:ATP-binding cassette subfamily F protein uup